jgi:hypothetical protein
MHRGKLFSAATELEEAAEVNANGGMVQGGGALVGAL